MHAPPWSRAGVFSAAIVGACAALACGGRGALGLDAPLAPAFAQAPGQSVAMALRIGLLFAIVIVPARTPGSPDRARTWAFLSVGIFFLLSLVVRGALSLFVLGAILDLAWLRRGDPMSARSTIGWVAVGACLVVLGLYVAKPDVVAPAPVDAPSLASTWRDRGNLWRARWYALAWASAESPPGEAYVALAEANWAIGRHDKARHVLEKVIHGEATAEIRQHAESVRQLWGP